jgi:hypothetical protein
VDNIKMDLGEIECRGMGWIGQAPDRDQWRTVVKAVMKLSGCIKYLEVLQ